MDVYVETDVGGHTDRATQAWSFEIDTWGRCGQGLDESTAVAELALQLNLDVKKIVVREQINGDEQAFSRDLQRATQPELSETQAILSIARRHTIELLSGCTAHQLEWIDPDRRLPDWANWHTIEAMCRHIAETESQYYLARLGIKPPNRQNDLIAELEASAKHVRQTLNSVPLHLIVRVDGEVWSTRKVLRRLAWHERSELQVIRALVARSGVALGLA